MLKPLLLITGVCFAKVMDTWRVSTAAFPSTEPAPQEYIVQRCDAGAPGRPEVFYELREWLWSTAMYGNPRGRYRGSMGIL